MLMAKNVEYIETSYNLENMENRDHILYSHTLDK